MHLSQLAAKPKLIEVIIESEEIIKEYGEPLAFHTWDRQPMETFMKLVSLSGKDVRRIVHCADQIAVLDSMQLVVCCRSTQ